MEKQKQGATTSLPSSSSSLPVIDLFGPEGSPKPSSSKTSFFGSIFDLPSASPVMGRGASSYPDFGNTHDSKGCCRIWKKGDEEKLDPCFYYHNSSIFYGGREVYPISNPNIALPHHTVAQDQSDSEFASRGNWWKGSLYY